jgi:hypothetical protein
MEIQIIWLLSSSSTLMSMLKNIYSEKFKNFLVFNLMVSLEGSLINGETSHGSCLTFSDHDCHFELSYELTALLS